VKTKILASVVAMLFVFNSVGRSFPESSPASAQEDWWKQVLIVGDARHWRSDLYVKSAADLHFDAIDSVGWWHPQGLSDASKKMIQSCHERNVKALSFLSIEVERGEFTKYYASLPESKKWRYTNGSVMSDPIHGGAAKNILGEPCGHWHIYQGQPLPDANLLSMSLNNPNFLSWQVEQAKMLIDAGSDGLAWYNIEMEPFSVTGDFSHWAAEAFRTYLKGKFDRATLLSLGVQDVEAFDMSLYLLSKYAKSESDVKRGDPGGSQITISTRSPVFEDALMREWTKFQRLTFISFFRELISQIRHYAQELKKNVALVTSLSTMGGYTMFSTLELYGLLLSNYFDMIRVQTSTKDFTVTSYVPEWSPSYRLEPIYKFARVAGAYEKPVWAYPTWQLDIPKTLAHKGCNLKKLAMAEAYAQGVMREVKFSDWTAEYQTANPPADLQQYLEFIWKNQRYLRGATSRANVAVVYSLPSFLWRFSPLFSMHGTSQRASIHGFARALEDSHVPYDIVFFGHPDLYEDQPDLKALRQYDVLVLPNVDCVTDKQMEALKEFVTRGGSIVASGEVATRNEEYVKRKENVLSELARIGGSRIVRFPDQPERIYWEKVIRNGVDDETNLGMITNAVRSVLNRPQLGTDGRRLVSINRFEQLQPFPRVIIHLVNDNYEFKDDSVRPQEKLPVRVRLPQDFRVGRVECRSPDDSCEYAELSFRMLQNGMIEFEVPRLFLWNVVAVRTEKEIQLDSSAMAAMRDAELSQEAAKKERRTVGLNDATILLQKSQDKYLRGNYEEAIDIATRAKEAADKATRETLEAISSSMKEHWPLILVSAAVVVAGSYVLVKKRRIAHERGRV